MTHDSKKGCSFRRSRAVTHEDIRGIYSYYTAVLGSVHPGQMEDSFDFLQSLLFHRCPPYGGPSAAAELRRGVCYDAGVLGVAFTGVGVGRVGSELVLES